MPSLAERDRRWALLDSLSEEQGFDVLILAGNDYRGHKGGLRWAADHNLHHSFGHVVKIPGRDAMLVLAGNLAAARRTSEAWITDYRFPANVGQGLEEAIREAGTVERVGIAGLNQILKVEQYLHLVEAFPGVEFVDASREFDRLRAVKSAEEIRAVEESAYILDQAFTRLLEIARPGMTERDIAAEMYRIGYRLGGEDPLFLTMYYTTFADGKQYASAGAPRDRVLRPHDVHTFSFELTGPEGYWTELARMVTFAPPSEDQRRVARALSVSLEEARKQLVPGADPSDVQRVVLATAEEYGVTTKNSSGHSLGSDVIEQPMIALAADAADPNRVIDRIAAGNAITVHPVLVDHAAGVSGYMSDVYIVGETGARKLSAHPTAFHRIADGEVHIIAD